MRGRPTDPTKIKTGQTRSRDPAKAQAKAIRKSLAKAAESPEVAAALAKVEAEKPDKPLRDGKGHSPHRRQGASVFMDALDLCEGITPEARLVIERIGKTGFTVKTASEFWAFQWLRIEAMRNEGQLLGKEYATALSQLATSGAKLAELAVRQGESSGPSAVNFQLNIAGALAGPAYVSPQPGPNGDAIEVG
jgi:hypothetical protein